MVKTNATSWNCSDVCDITNITDTCKECIKTKFTDELDKTSSNYNNILKYVPAAINVDYVKSNNFGYGIYVRNSIETFNDSIRIDSHEKSYPPIMSIYGNGVVVNSSNINSTDITRKNAIISK